jgi:hypothetical protein
VNASIMKISDEESAIELINVRGHRCFLWLMMTLWAALTCLVVWRMVVSRGVWLLLGLAFVLILALTAPAMWRSLRHGAGRLILERDRFIIEAPAVARGSISISRAEISAVELGRPPAGIRVLRDFRTRRTDKAPVVGVSNCHSNVLVRLQRERTFSEAYRFNRVSNYPPHLKPLDSRSTVRGLRFCMSDDGARVVQQWWERAFDCAASSPSRDAS